MQRHGLGYVQLLIQHHIVFHDPTVLVHNLRGCVRVAYRKLNVPNVLIAHVDQHAKSITCTADQLGIGRVHGHIHEHKGIPQQNGERRKTFFSQRSIKPSH